MSIPRYKFAKVHDPFSGGPKIVGHHDPGRAAEYTSRSGKDIPAALSEVASHIDEYGLDLIGRMNRSYQLEDWEELEELFAEARMHMSSRAFSALRVFDGLPD